MKFYEKKDITTNAHARVCLFESETGSPEYHIIIGTEGNDYTFAEQLKNVQVLFDDLFTGYSKDKNVFAFKRYFLSDAANQADLVYETEKGTKNAVLSVIQQPPMNGSKIALWAYLTEGEGEEVTNGYIVQRNGYRHHWSGGWKTMNGDSEQQTMSILSEYVKEIEKYGYKLEKDCLRTWLYVQNVDANYAGLVKARREFFSKENLTEKTHFITSTGIEGRCENPSIKAVMDAYSVHGLDRKQITYLHGLSHLNPTYEYGVTFERGVNIEFGDRKHYYISGTASIDNKGMIVHPGNIKLQTLRMWENVDVLLEEGGSSRKDIAQILVYIRDTGDYRVVKEMFEQKFPATPYVILLAPVCRPGWLIEMECIGIRKHSNLEYKVF